MNHVTDERTDRPLGRPLHDWIEGSIEELPDGAELPSAVRSDVLSRLPGTPQRRRWWPFRWLPFGIGATRSADREESRPEGRSKSMLTATRIAAGVAILALAGSLALVAGPFGNDPAPGPAAPMEDIDPADFGGFTGTLSCSSEGPFGDTTLTEWGSITEGQTWSDCVYELSDLRISGRNYAVHDYYKYDTQPTWGVRNGSAVISNGDGYWVSTNNWGFQQPEDGTMSYAIEWRGAEAYEGLSALMLMSQDRFGLQMDVTGVIIPGDLPEAPETPLEAALAAAE